MDRKIVEYPRWKSQWIAICDSVENEELSALKAIGGDAQDRSSR